MNRGSGKTERGRRSRPAMLGGVTLGAMLIAAAGCGGEETAPEATRVEPMTAAMPPVASVETPVGGKAADAKPSEPAVPAPADPAPADVIPADTAPPEEEALTAETRPAAEVGEPLLVEREGFRIVGVTLARGVEKTADRKRIPLEPGSRFAVDGRRVYAILDIENPSEEEGRIKVGWIWPGSDKERNTVTVTIKPEKKWRTWAFNGFIKKPGLWQVVFRDEADDTVLGRAAFEMEETDVAVEDTTPSTP